VAMSITETDGVWGAVTDIPSSGSEVQLGGVSCTSPNNCTSVGSANIGTGDVPLMVTETNGVWGPAAVTPVFPAADGQEDELGGISCASVGECTATGGAHHAGDQSGGRTLRVTETGGVWGSYVIGPDGPTNSTLSDISCPQPGNCTAVGYMDNGGQLGDAMYVAETNGTWGSPTSISGATVMLSVSCADVGDCVAVGGTLSSSYASETAGSWGSATPFPAGAVMTQVSCSDLADCTAVGRNLLGPGGNSPVYASTSASQNPLLAEVPYAALLPLGALVAGAATLTRRKRRLTNA
jgi:hypothetical protein